MMRHKAEWILWTRRIPVCNQALLGVVWFQFHVWIPAKTWRLGKAG
jgi:hypothetical protein